LVKLLLPSAVHYKKHLAITTVDGCCLVKVEHELFYMCGSKRAQQSINISNLIMKVFYSIPTHTYSSLLLHHFTVIFMASFAIAGQVLYIHIK
jgi:hypothetical protein